MVYLYTGTPGSGKSLHMARDIYDACNMSANRHLVIVNFPVNTEFLKHPERVIYVPNDELSPFRIYDICMEFWGDRKPKEGTIKLFIDECQLIFNSRSWNEAGRKDWISLFTQHRKLGLDVYLVAQFDEMVDKQIRCLVEYEVTHRKVSNFGFIGFILKIISFGGLFISVYRWYGIKERISYEYFRARKRYYKLYDTLAIFDSFKWSKDTQVV